MEVNIPTKDAWLLLSALSLLSQFPLDQHGLHQKLFPPVQNHQIMEKEVTLSAICRNASTSLLPP